jgi:photosystem II stability/assembly factor-like uncharacterized protein
VTRRLAARRPPPRRAVPLACALVAAVLLGGCGSDDGRSVSDRLVDPQGEQPLVNAFDVDPADGSFLLTTNRGFFRIAPDGSEVDEVRSSVDAGGTRAAVGTFLFLAAVGPGELLGSGHPDDETRGLPQYLGLMRSNDAGRTWAVVSRLGEADLHVLRVAHGRLYALDAVLGMLLLSDDGGRTFAERALPRQEMTDLVVSPAEPGVMLASADDGLFRSTDGGATWRPGERAREARLAWVEGESVLRADRDGRILASEDGGERWRQVGLVDGTPAKLHALDARRAFLALDDGSILATEDGGRTFSERFRP